MSLSVSFPNFKLSLSIQPGSFPKVKRQRLRQISVQLTRNDQVFFVKKQVSCLDSNKEEAPTYSSSYVGIHGRRSLGKHTCSSYPLGNGLALYLASASRRNLPRASPDSAQPGSSRTLDSDPATSTSSINDVNPASPASRREDVSSATSASASNDVASTSVAGGHDRVNRATAVKHQKPPPVIEYLEWNGGGNSAGDRSAGGLLAESSTLHSTTRLVETAMLAATAGLAFFLSNLLRLESYFGSFFPLPIVISSVRWGAGAGRKTMVATALLLFVLSGPLKALSYLVPWPVSIIACSLARCVGLIGFVVFSSWLVQENLLQLMTVNAHASVSLLLASMGSSLVPTMAFIYAATAGMLALNCVVFVVLVHFLYAIFLRRAGLGGGSPMPAWLQRAL